MFIFFSRYLPLRNEPIRRLNLTNNKFTQSLTQLEKSITYFRKTIGQLTVIVKCKQTNTYSKHQKSLLEKFRKKFRITTLLNLQSNLYITKQKLKAKSEKLKYHKKFYERKTTNPNFSCDSKSVYRTMTGSRITAEKIPTKYEVETFCKNIWRGPGKTFNENSSWISELEINKIRYVNKMQ